MIELPGYQILRELGRGGMARVYLALHEGLDRRVAIKVMHPKLSADRAFSERFLREARIVAKLSHPNIITIFDVNVSAGSHYIAMEYMPGESLGNKIKVGMGTGKALSILKQISMGLKFAHDKGFIHRDIKPENILFTEDDSAIITDFGVARALASATMMTKAGTIIGTPRYMSPEQAQGHELKSNSDIYSLGVVFYMMLTGLIPYRADTPVAMMYQHVNAPIPELMGQLSFLQPLLDKLLAKKAEDRYQDAGDIINDIEAIGDIEDSIDTEFATRVMLSEDFTDEKTREITLRRKIFSAGSFGEEPIIRKNLENESTHEVTLVRKSFGAEHSGEEIVIRKNSDDDQTKEITMLRKDAAVECPGEETILRRDLDDELTHEVTLRRNSFSAEHPAEKTVVRKIPSDGQASKGTMPEKGVNTGQASNINRPQIESDDGLTGNIELSCKDIAIEDSGEINQDVLQATSSTSSIFSQKHMLVISSFMLIAILSTITLIKVSVDKHKLIEAEQRMENKHLVTQRHVDEERARHEAMIQQREERERIVAEKEREARERIVAEKEREVREQIVTEKERLALAMREKVTKARKIEQHISLLISKAESALEKGELLDAHDLFQQILAMDKNNKPAIKGVVRIAERYLALAEKEAENIHFDKADSYIHSAMTMSPSHPRLVATQQIIFELKSKHFAKKAETQDENSASKINRQAEVQILPEKKLPTQRSFGGF